MYALFTAIPLIGHLNPLLRQAEELHRRGWRVAFAGATEVKSHVEREAVGVSFVDLGPLGEIGSAIRNDMEAASADSNFVRGSVRIATGLERVWPSMFRGLKQAIGEDRPDVMIVDLFSAAGHAVAEAEGIPFVVNNPDLLAALPVTLLPPAEHLPHFLSGRSLRTIPWHQPFSSPVTRGLATLATHLIVEKRLARLRKSVGLAPITLKALFGRRQILVNGAFGLEYERPIPESVSMVGPMLSKAVPPLPADIDAWLGDGLPVVYVNLGTLAIAQTALLEKMRVALESDKFRCLWILPAAQAARLPRQDGPGVRVLEWGPAPIAVLRHPNVKVFVSHCGINSAYESMVAGTPVVGIPMFADQRDMAIRLADAGTGVWLDKTKFTAKELSHAIERVLFEPLFRDNIPRVHADIRKAGGVERAADLIEQAAAAHYGRRA